MVDARAARGHCVRGPGWRGLHVVDEARPDCQGWLRDWNAQHRSRLTRRSGEHLRLAETEQRSGPAGEEGSEPVGDRPKQVSLADHVWSIEEIVSLLEQ